MSIIEDHSVGSTWSSNDAGDGVHVCERTTAQSNKLRWVEMQLQILKAVAERVRVTVECTDDEIRTIRDDRGHLRRRHQHKIVAVSHGDAVQVLRLRRGRRLRQRGPKARR